MLLNVQMYIFVGTYRIANDFYKYKISLELQFAILYLCSHEMFTLLHFLFLYKKHHLLQKALLKELFKNNNIIFVRIILLQTLLSSLLNFLEDNIKYKNEHRS